MGFKRPLVQIQSLGPMKTVDFTKNQRFFLLFRLFFLLPLPLPTAKNAQKSAQIGVNGLEKP